MRCEMGGRVRVRVRVALRQYLVGQRVAARRVAIHVLLLLLGDENALEEGGAGFRSDDEDGA